MSSIPHSADSVLKKEAIGFSILIALAWLTELLGVPHWFFNEPAGFLWPRVLIRTAVVLGIWAWVHFTTRRLLKRLHHLEEFLLVCSWCRKVGHDGDWLTMEEYFGSKFSTETSHGICAECAKKQFTAHHTATRVEKPAADSAKQ